MLRFDTVNELVEFSKSLVRSKTNRLLKKDINFRAAYVAFCKAHNVPLSTYAEAIGVGSTTPYGWVTEYQEAINNEVTEPREDLDILELADLPKADPMYEKVLGKISAVSFGIRSSRLGLHLEFSISSSGVRRSECFWDYSMERSEYAPWTEADRDQSAIDTLKLLSKTLLDAKVQTVDQLANKPIELTLDRNILKSWRILTEVL